MLSCRLNRYYCRLRRPPGTHPLPGIPVIRHAASDDTLRRSPGRGGPLQFPPPPLIRSAPHTPGSPSRLHSRIYTASVAFALMEGARHSLIPTQRQAILTTPQASLHATDRIIAPPLTGLLTLGFNAGRFPPTLPACYRASWQLPGPDSHRQATTNLRTQGSATNTSTHSLSSRPTGRTPNLVQKTPPDQSHPQALPTSSSLQRS